MKTVTHTIYEFDELSDKAKERAKQDDAAWCGYSWSDEALDSLKALADHFGGRLARYSIDWFDCTPSDAKFEMPDEMEPAEIEARLAKLGEYNKKTLQGLGDCVLTGYCADEDAIDGFRKAFASGERDLDTLMQAAFGSWLRGAQSDCKGQYEDDVFSETCSANGWYFYADGERA